ncbi:hypothetical protein ALC57_18412, partial [Trachymyrmex cornetzi]
LTEVPLLVTFALAPSPTVNAVNMALLPLPFCPTIKLTFSFSRGRYLFILHRIILGLFETFGLVLVGLLCRFPPSSLRVVFHTSRDVNRWRI